MDVLTYCICRRREQHTVCLAGNLLLYSVWLYISKAWKHLYNIEEHLNDISLTTILFSSCVLLPYRISYFIFQYV